MLKSLLKNAKVLAILFLVLMALSYGVSTIGFLLKVAAVACLVGAIIMFVVNHVRKPGD
jgi:uncharacterized ion transporter superfamily protein YfcC